jgi:hypothetical protein
MNPANLQLEGVYIAMAALVHALRDKGALSAEEIDAALANAEEKLAADPGRKTKLSDASRDGVFFPIRFLRLANQASAEGKHLSFSQLASRVGQTKPD